MSEVTVEQLAEDVRIPVDRLLAQLAEAGIHKSDAADAISEEEKLTLLNFLRKSHGKDGKKVGESPKKITLKRRTVSELKQPTVTGGARPATRASRVPSKTVSVEVRRKRTYVKRETLPDDQDIRNKEAEEARVALAEQAEQQRQLEEQERARREAEIARKAELENMKGQKAEKEREAERLEQEKRDQEAAEAASLIKDAEEKKKAETNAQQPEIQSEAAAPAPARDEAKTKKNKAKKGHTKHPEVLKEVDGKVVPLGEAIEGKVVPEPAIAAQVEERLPKKKEEIKRKPGRKESKKIERRPNRRDKGGRHSRQNQPHGFTRPTAPVVHEVPIPEDIAVGELAQRMSIKAVEVIKALMKMGVMATINQSIDRDTASLVVEEMGHVVIEQKDEDVETEILAELAHQNLDVELQSRAPVVTIMGHVDHGKTSLLDYIRSSRVASGEAGGITQHIGAYHVDTDKGMVTFLDTPGHAAFSAMRARGAKATDIVVIVVAADDGVMPQTREAIHHARAAEVPIVIAVNKIDKEDANADRVMQELVAEEVVPEAWGGDTMFVQVSAKTGQGVDELLDTLEIQAEMLELTASVQGLAKGVIIESSLDKGRGAVATVLVQSGTLNRGDILVSGSEFGRVRALFDENGKSVKSAGPSLPVQVLGLSNAPNAGDDVLAVDNERKARELAELRQERARDTKLADQKAVKLDQLFSQMGSGEIDSVNLIVKADVQGSVEALKESLIKLSTDEVKVKVIASGVGGINESDANLALTSTASIIGFNVRADASARRVIEEKGVDLRYYSIIYEIIDDVKKAISGKLSPEIKEEIIGLAEVRDVFRSSKLGSIAGCMVVEGLVKRNNPIRVLRDNVVIYEGSLESLRRYKDDVPEVKSGTECGIGVKNYNDIKTGDHIEVFERTEVAREV